MKEKTPKTTRPALGQVLAPVTGVLAGCATLVWALAAGGAGTIHWAEQGGSMLAAALGAGILAASLVLALGSRSR